VLPPDGGNGDGGAKIEVGVCIGVFWVEEAAVAVERGCLVVVTVGPSGEICPSSPGAKVRVEQKPSEDVMRSVRPSVDLLMISTCQVGIE